MSALALPGWEVIVMSVAFGIASVVIALAMLIVQQMRRGDVDARCRTCGCAMREAGTQLCPECGARR